ncbi:hypothetical protein D3C86_2219140 [compost metagenome]
MDRIRRRNVVACREGFVVPAVAKGDGEQGVFRSDDVLTRGHCRTLGDGLVAIDDAYFARFVAGATD